MAEYPFFQVDAFASKPFEGNQACVMPMDAFLEDEVLLAIAAENNVAENVTQAQGRVEQLNKLGVNAEPVDISQEFNNFINDSNTSTRDSINAKLRMLDTLKEDKK